MLRPAYLLLTLASLFWAGNFVMARAMHAEIPPVALAFWRWALALLLLLPMAIAPIRRQWRLLAAEWRRILPLAVLGVTGYNTLVYLAVQQTSASNAVLVHAFVPMFTFVLGAGLLGHRLRGPQVLGVLLSTTGVLLIIGRADLQLVQQLGFNQGDLLVLLAALCWATYTVILNGLDPAIDRLGLLALITAIGLAGILPLYLWEQGLGRAWQLTPVTLATIGYMGLFPSVLAYLFYNVGVAQVGPERASLFIHLMPVFGVLLSLLLLGERLALYHAVGICAILAGIYLATRRVSVR